MAAPVGRLLAWLGAGALLAGGCGDSTPPHRDALRFDGIGPIRVGLPIAEVERLVGATARIERIEPGDECGYAYLPPLPGLALMLAGDTVVRVDVSGTHIRSEAGAGVGTPEADVLARYRGMVRVESHPYTGPEGHYLIVDDPSRPGLRMIFETDGRVVTDVRAGRPQETDLIEGCA